MSLKAILWNASQAFNNFRELILFFVASISSTLLDLIIFFILLKFFESVVIPNIISYNFGILFSFLFNKHLTFSKIFISHSIVKEAFKFFSVSVGGLILATIVIYSFSPIIGPMFSKIASLPITFFWNFTLSKLFVFK